jgi:hypothetical protein
MPKTPPQLGPDIGVDQEYPKTLVHPAYTPAVIPPVTVNNLDLEKEYLDKGYIPVARTPRPPRGMRSAAIGDPPLAEQRFDKASFETQLNSASRALLEERKAVEETDAGLGHLPLMSVLEMIEKAGDHHAWARLKRAAIRGKVTMRGMVDGEPREIDPLWLHYLKFEPDGDVLYIDQKNALAAGVKVPRRVSNVTAESAGIEEMWPGSMQSQSDACDAERYKTDPNSLPMPAPPAIGGPNIDSPVKLPLRGEARVAAIDTWADKKWGPDFIELPNRKELLQLARGKFPDSRVSIDDIAVLRRNRATEKAQRGGFPTHKRNPKP